SRPSVSPSCTSTETPFSAHNSSACTRIRTTRSLIDVGRSRYRRNRFFTSWTVIAAGISPLQLLREVPGHVEERPPAQEEQERGSDRHRSQVKGKPSQAHRKQRRLASRAGGRHHPVQSSLEPDHD